MNRSLSAIHECGQSIWLDNLTRDLIRSDELKQMVESRKIWGITSNPAIFQKAIADNVMYDADIKVGIKARKSVEEIYESLIFDDIQNACDILRPVYEESQGLDGYVSIEVPPTLSQDTEATLQAARHYSRAIGRQNVMIKIPGTASGFPAIRQAIQEGISINVTLLFSIDSYLKAAQAYIEGLEARLEEGGDISRVASVASFFLSRIDTKVDKLLDKHLTTTGTETLNKEARLTAVQGKIAIANAKIAYQNYKQIIQSETWEKLAVKGAKVQRLLWASTSTKNPSYSDVMYVDELVGPETVTTLPPATLEACVDHCEAAANRLESGVEEAYRLMESLKEPDIDIDINQVMEEVLEEGIDLFIQPFNSLISSLRQKIEELSVGV
jgi:transaldolase